MLNNLLQIGNDKFECYEKDSKMHVYVCTSINAKSIHKKKNIDEIEFV